MELDAPAHTNLIDAASRRQFSESIFENFSVIAPAGVGKTTAIVERIVNMMARGNFEHLAVVTYTQKAANEMRERVEKALLKLKQKVPANTNVYFGTLHGFCLFLIQKYGVFKQIPHNLTVIDIQNNTELWHAFLNSSVDIFQNIPDDFQPYARSFFKVWEPIVAQIMDGKPKPWQPFPKLNFDAVYNFETTPKNREKIEQDKLNLQHWAEALNQFHVGLELPECSSSHAAFRELWANSLTSLHTWLEHHAYNFALSVAALYRQYRLSHNCATYDDLIVYAKRIVDDKQLIRDFHCKVVLDEAQDTDAQQFEVLLKLVDDGTNDGLSPKQGHFCMVGDPQQSIYGRADVEHYVQLHRTLVERNRVRSLTFNVTMRCQSTLVQHLNEHFPKILNTTHSKVKYVPLVAQPRALQGITAKWSFIPPEQTDVSVEERTRVEANAIAEWLRRNSASLGINDWSEIAFLCPRNSWLQILSDAFRDANMPHQLHSRTGHLRDHPFYAWLCALWHITLFPNDAFEIIGVLREIFAIPDADIARYVEQHYQAHTSHPVQLCHIFEPESEVGKVLVFLKNCVDAMSTMSACESLRYWITQAQLVERCALLNHDSTTIVHTILAKISAWENQGLDKFQILEALKNELDATPAPIPAWPDHIQLLSCHNAKGLQWPIVIVPFCFRPIGTRKVYPDIRGECVILDSQSQYFNDDTESLKRLLYVTLTRSSQSLIVVDDAMLFAQTRSTAPSFGSLLGDFISTMPNLPDNLSNTSFSLTPKIISTPGVEQIEFSEIGTPPNRPIVQYFKPSLMTHDTTHSTRGGRGAQYGLLWHAWMEHLPWHDRSQWGTYLAVPPQSVYRQEMLHEGKMLLKALRRSDLVPQAPGWVRTEVSCFGQIDKATIVDGRVDWVAYDPRTQTFTVIDWKTDHEDPATVVIKYTQQLGIYKKCLQIVCQKSVRVFLYHTPTGQFLTIED